ncbi:MAG: helix-turn-helix domain-containing protein [Sulfobacillus sp.]
MSEVILDADKVGLYLGLSQTVVYRLLQEGEIPATKVGGQWRTRLSDLERAIGLARAKTLALQREKEAITVWGDIVAEIKDMMPDADILLTRCLWCPETCPAIAGYRSTTVCSTECAAEVSRTYGFFRWPLPPYILLSPLYPPTTKVGKDPSINPVPSEEVLTPLLSRYWDIRHQRGPMRDVLLLERPILRYHLLGEVATLSAFQGRSDEAAELGTGSRDALEMGDPE